MIDLKAIVHKDFTEKNGVLYFIDVPKDVEPSQHKDSTDKKSWSHWRKENYEFLKKELRAFQDGFVVLDIGAGEMQFRDILERFHLVAVDFYPYPGIRVVCDLNRSFPFLDNSADILVLSNMLEHSAEPNALLAECLRVLKPGGIILGAVPFMINIHQRPYDFYRYTDINLNYLLRKHGFTKVEVHPVMIPSALTLAVSSSFFIHLIEHSEYSRNRFVQNAYVLGLRVLWKIIRITFVIFDPVFKKCAPDENLPLGYHFKARKNL
ncbi:MAG: class I SAM-dependent methyltransferase [bacterium]|nr:class I SAM-dependent methyltransferase [bacterium]